jgi:hypothetical protein
MWREKKKKKGKKRKECRGTQRWPPPLFATTKIHYAAGLQAKK